MKLNKIHYRVWDCRLKEFVEDLDGNFGLDWKGQLRCLHCVRENDSFAIQISTNQLDRNNNVIFDKLFLKALFKS
jgi:hypothetical protein